MSDLRKSGEDYLEAILFIEEEKGIVKSVDIATYLGVSKPSVNKALTVIGHQGPHCLNDGIGFLLKRLI